MCAHIRFRIMPACRSALIELSAHLITLFFRDSFTFIILAQPIASGFCAFGFITRNCGACCQQNHSHQSYQNISHDYHLYKKKYNLYKYYSIASILLEVSEHIHFLIETRLHLIHMSQRFTVLLHGYGIICLQAYILHILPVQHIL